MKKSNYKDYAKYSDYFVDKEEVLKDEIETTENQKKYIVWVQEFSKKIVLAVFVMYVISTIISILLIFLSYKQGLIAGLDTLISETNQTFREIVGGYIVKAAVENSFKIAGNYFIGICDARLRALKNNLTEEDGIGGLDNTETPDVDFSEDNV